MPNVTVRRAETEDAEALLELMEIASGGFVRSAFAEAKPADMTVDEFILSRMGDESSGLSYSKLWVAEADGAAAGFIALDRTPDATEPVDPGTPPMFRPLAELEHEAPGCCLINLIATFPQFRGAGAGLALMRHAESRRGPNGVCLTVGDANVDAQRFYTRLGFRTAGRRAVVKENWNTPYSDWLLMVKA